MFVVAGVTGHVGSICAGELLSHGEKVKVLVRDAAKGTEWSKKGAEVAVATFEDGRALTAALKGAEGFFVLLPPNYGISDFFAYQRKVADTIISAVRDSAVPHVVMLSSVGADLTEGNGPIKMLAYLENGLRGVGVKLSAVRAGYFQENAGSVLGAAKQQGIFPNMTPNADYPMPMLATRDIGVVAAHELMFPPARSEVIDLLGPAYSTRQAAEKVGAMLGKTLKVVDVPADQHVGALKQGGMSQEMAELFAEMYAGFASGRIFPKGNRLIQGRTPLDATLRQLG